MLEFSNYSVGSYTIYRYGLHTHLEPNQLLIKSLNIIVEVVDIIYCGKKFHVCGLRDLRLLSP